VGSDYDGVELTEIDRPEPDQGQVLIRVGAASLNYPDLLMPLGKYQRKPDPPFTLGGDLAGEIVSVGKGVTRFRAGDFVSGIGLGAFAEYAVLPEATVDAKPANFDFAQTAAFGAAYLTAYVGLRELAHLECGEWLLVHGATGGIGLAAVDLGRVFGARVIASSTSDAKLAQINSLYSPDAVLNVREGFREEVKRITGKEGADVIFDPVNGDLFDESVRCIAFGGRLLVIGFTSGRIAEIRTNLPLIKGFSIIGVRAGEYGRRFPDRRRRVSAELLNLANEGKLRPHIDSRFEFKDWREAFARMRSREALGKIILEVS